MGLGERKRSGPLATRQWTEELLLLLNCAELHDGHAANRVVPTYDRRRSGIACGQLLEDDGHGEGIGTRPAPFLRHGNPEEAEFAHFPQFGLREVTRLVPFSRVRRQLLLGERVRHVTDHRLLFVQDHRALCTFDAPVLLCRRLQAHRTKVMSPRKGRRVSGRNAHLARLPSRKALTRNCVSAVSKRWSVSCTS